MKYILLVMAIALSGCTPSAQEIIWPVVPDELKDCKFYELVNSKGATMKVVRCPMSSTSVQYQSGKTTVNTIVIDGVEYTKKWY